MCTAVTCQPKRYEIIEKNNTSKSTLFTIHVAISYQFNGDLISSQHHAEDARDAGPSSKALTAMQGNSQTADVN